MSCLPPVEPVVVAEPVVLVVPDVPVVPDEPVAPEPVLNCLTLSAPPLPKEPLVSPNESPLSPSDELPVSLPKEPLPVLLLPPDVSPNPELPVEAPPRLLGVEVRFPISRPLSRSDVRIKA